MFGGYILLGYSGLLDNNSSLIPQGSGDMQQKSLVKSDEFVGHQSDSRKVKLAHYVNLRHNNGVWLNKPGNL